MRIRALATAIAVGLALCPGIATLTAAAPLAGQAAPPRPEPATHATRGTVKSVNADVLVVVRPRHRGEITFALTSATTREGIIVAGAVVSIRYREDQSLHVATAVAVERARK